MDRLTMEFRILGPLEVVEGGSPVRVPGTKERALLAVLLLHAGTVVSADRLIDDLWGDAPPANAANALQVRVSQLRRALGPEVIETRAPGYRLAAAPEQIDAHRFEQLIGERRFAEALALWRGPALADLAAEPFARAEVARLEERRLTTVEDATEARLVTGGGPELVGELEALVARHPLRERLHGQLMRALYRAGRQAEALDAYRLAREVLADELGIDPSPALQELERAVLAQDPSLAAPVAPAGPATNLPVRYASFVGRRGELEEVAKLFEGHRLVTLTGPGGVGKTTLALRVAGGQHDRHADGVWLVELAGVTDATLLPQAVGAALHLREQPDPRDRRTPAERLVDRLAGWDLLVVLDNAEHLVEACAELADQLLRAAPGLSLLVTSREPLGLPGEVRWLVPPLGLPQEGAPLPVLAGADAVRLLVERAEAADPGFVLDAANAADVAELCRRLDGLPLAIELAAARVGALPVPQITARLPNLAGRRGADARQRTLRATIGWSHDLLTPSERLLFARLSVFGGGWTAEAAEAVGAGEGLEATALLDSLLSLVDRSLVTTAGRPPRFGMLNTVRAYAAERLAASGEEDAVRRRHAAWFRDLAQGRPGNAVLEAEQDNLRGAADWALADGDRETALSMNAALVWFWATGRLMEGRQRLAAVLAAPHPAPSRALARALLAQAQLEAEAFSMAGAAGTTRASLEMFAQLGDDAGVAESKVLLALHAVQGERPVAEAQRLLDDADAVARDLRDQRVEGWAAAARMLLELLRLGHLDAAIASGRRALAHFRAVDEEWGVAFTLSHLAFATRQRGDLEEAGRLYADAAAYARLTHQWWMTSMALTELGSLAFLAGDQARADGLHGEALALVERMEGPRRIAFTLNAMGVTARVRGDHERARELHGRALRLHTELTHPRVAWSECLLGLAEAALGHTERAGQLLRAALVTAHERTQPHTVALALEGLAGLAAAAGDARGAGELLGAATAVRERAQTPPDPIEQADRDRAMETVAAEDALAFERGRAAPLASVVASARLGVQPRPVSAP